MKKNVCTHTDTHTLSSDTLDNCAEGKTIVTLTPDVVFLLMSIPFRLTSMCVWPDRSPLLGGLSFSQIIWTNTNLTPTKGTVVSAKWFVMNWCIKVIFSFENHLCRLCQISIVFFYNAFLVPKFCHCKELSAMPIIMFKASTRNVYCQSPYPCRSLRTVCSFHSVSVVV